MGRNTCKAICILAALILAILAAGCGILKEREQGNSDYAVLEEVPEYGGEPYAEVCGNVPGFTDEEIRDAGTDLCFFSDMDRLE